MFYIHLQQKYRCPSKYYVPFILYVRTTRTAFMEMSYARGNSRFTHIKNVIDLKLIVLCIREYTRITLQYICVNIVLYNIKQTIKILYSFDLSCA